MALSFALFPTIVYATGGKGWLFNNIFGIVFSIMGVL